MIFLFWVGGFVMSTNLEDGIDSVAVLSIAGCHVQVPFHGHDGLRRSAAVGEHGGQHGKGGGARATEEEDGRR